MEGDHENPLQYMFVGLLRVESGVRPLPRFAHGLLVPCKTPTYPLSLNGTIFLSSLDLKESHLNNI